MQIKNYLQNLLDEISTNPYIKSQNISFEERPPDAAYISGLITFINGSKLHFKEFVIFKSDTGIILKYGYNYLENNNTTIFRYDNALDPHAKNLATYPEHKHTSNGLASAERPSFKVLLNEISGLIEKESKR